MKLVLSRRAIIDYERDDRSLWKFELYDGDTLIDNSLSSSWWLIVRMGRRAWRRHERRRRGA